MTMKQNEQVEAIKAQYLPAKASKLDELKALDRKVKRPAEIFAYTFGTIGSLVLGTGMCLAMKIIGDLMPLGIGIGLAGIAMVSANYFLYNKLLKRRKEKYAAQIVALSDSLLNN